MDRSRPKETKKIELTPKKIPQTQNPEPAQPNSIENLKFKNTKPPSI